MIGRVVSHRGRRFPIVDYYLLHVALRRPDGSIYWAPISEIEV